VSPRTLLAIEQLHACLNLVNGAGVDYPNHGKASFLVAVLHPDRVARSQLLIEPGDHGPFAADVSGLGVLKEWAAIFAHAPYPHREFGFHARFRTL
jgi:hypothetical protein